MDEKERSIENQNPAKEEEKRKNDDVEYKKVSSFQGRTKNYQPLGREMELMRDTKYVKERLDSQIDWYNKKSTLNQKKFKKLKRVEIIIATSVPVLISFSTMGIVKDSNFGQAIHLDTIFQIIAAISGIIVVVLNKLFELEDYQKLWKDYRLTCEALQHERMLYMTKTEPYDEPNAFPMLVEKVENILHKETQKWKQIAIPKQNEMVNKAQALVEKEVENLEEYGLPKELADKIRQRARKDIE